MHNLEAYDDHKMISDLSITDLIVLKVYLYEKASGSQPFAIPASVHIWDWFCNV